MKQKIGFLVGHMLLVYLDCGEEKEGLKALASLPGCIDANL